MFTSSVSILTTPIHASGPTANDLVAAVNAYRAANGYYTMNPHTLVFQAAQAHAEWIVETGQGGHIGAGGSDETMRVAWTGYGGGAQIQCDENWTSGRTIDDALYVAWSDWTHQEVMLNQWGNLYTDIGGGVAEWGDGRYVFILNVCKVIGQEASGDVPDTNNESPAAAIPPTPDYSNYIYGVVKATPQYDGTVIHVVQYGQSLVNIADAYGVTIETLRSLNEMGADENIIWVDEELLIQSAGSAATYTPEGPPAETDSSPAPSSADAIQTQPPQPSLSESTTSITATPQAAPTNGPRTSTAGMVILGFAGFGLALSLYFSLKKK